MKRTPIELDDFWASNAAHIRHGALRAKRVLEQRLSGEVYGYPTGLTVMDKYIRFLPAEYTLIGARPGTGKTALVLQLLQSIEKRKAESGDHRLAVFFSAEMDAGALVLRLACSRVGVPMFRIYQDDEITKEELNSVMAAVDTITKDMPIWVDETSAPTVDHMVAQLEMMLEGEEIAIVFFDYLELAGETSGTESLRIAEISRGLKRIAKQFQVPVIALAQLKRDVEERADKEPRMSDFMYGGERECDRMIAMVRNEDDEGIINCHVLKNRNGPMGVFHLRFHGPTMRFTSEVMVRTELNEQV